jgi:formate hydrogenlyase subunit 6/NADH:ubiquinone oxidoreductase subunit I
MHILAKANLIEAIERLVKEFKVLVPMQYDGVSRFSVWGSHGMQAFNASNTLLPPKDSLFPRTETLYAYQVANQEITGVTVRDQAEHQIIFGIRPCDMQSIHCLDDVFLTKGYADSYYHSKREKLLTVCIGCTKSEPTCFCESMGINPAGHSGADIQMNDLGSGYRVVAQSQSGQEIVEKWKDLLSQGQEEVVAASCTLKVDMNGVPEMLATLFEHSLWQEVSRKCIGCGTCTYLCPTCHCFDMDVQNQGNQGTRFRCWDSCMFSDYSRMAGGHDPRPSKSERLRNRFLHKLQFFSERYGKSLCVGCGRCLIKCPVHVDITLLIDQVRKEAAHV